MKTILIILSMMLPILTYATGNLKGTLTDEETEDPIPFANIIIEKDGAHITGATTDFDGFYVINGLEPGRYDVKATYVGYAAKMISGVLISEGKTTYQNIELISTMQQLEEVVIVSYKVPLISKDFTCSGATITSEEISSARRSKGSRRVRASRSKVDKTKASKDYEVFGIGEKVEHRKTSLHHRLTAGELNDFSKWELWEDISTKDLINYQKIWEISPEDRYVIQLINKGGRPLVDCDVELLDENGFSIWKAKTDNTGKAELWANLFKDDGSNKLAILVHGAFDDFTVEDAYKFSEGVNQIQVPEECNNHSILDIAFVVDATGSMSDEINYLKSELHNIIENLETKHPELTIKLGSVFYRDFGDEYLTVKSDLSIMSDKTIQFIKKQFAAGGGDGPEAVDEALEVAVNDLNWSSEARCRLMFLILDAPPHQDKDVKRKLEKAIALAAEKGIRIIPITASGIDKSTEYLMRCIALATNGTYVFLTDHSGIGGGHIEPTTDKYDVELLNDLLVRLIYQYTFAPDCNDFTYDLSDISDTSYIFPKKIIKEEIIDAEFISENQKEKDVRNIIFDEEGEEIKTNEVLIEKSMNYVKFYPNPATDNVNIKIEGKVDELFLTDISGKLLQRIDCKRNEEINLIISDYPSGVYFFRYKQDNAWQAGKVIFRN